MTMEQRPDVKRHRKWTDNNRVWKHDKKVHNNVENTRGQSLSLWALLKINCFFIYILFLIRTPCLILFPFINSCYLYLGLIIADFWTFFDWGLKIRLAFSGNFIVMTIFVFVQNQAIRYSFESSIETYINENSYEN